MKKYNFDEIIERRNTNSEKWDEGLFHNSDLPKEYIPMWTADMDFACAQPMLDAMKARIDKRILGYASYTSSMPQEYFDSIISWQKRRHNIVCTRENIAFSASIMACVREVVNTWSKDGDGVMIHVPDFPYIYTPVMEFDRKTVMMPLINTNGYYTIDYDLLEKECAKPENTLLVLCSPHNPSGRVWTEQELRRLVEICFAHDVRILVDEVHADIVRLDVQVTSLFSLYPNEPRIVTLTSTGKTFNNAGLQHSYAITFDSKLKAAIDDSRYCGSPNPLSMTSMIAAYNECEDWVDELREYLDKNIDYLDTFIHENMPKVKFWPPEGTYLCWLDMRAYGKSEEELVKQISRAGLQLSYGSEFLDGGVGFVRMNVACPRSRLIEGCNRLKKAMDGD